MSSREGSHFGPLDLLIAEALQAQVEGAEPSPRVWKRLRRQAEAWAIRRWLRPDRPWGRVASFLSHVDVFLGLPSPPPRSVAAWRYDLVAMRMLGNGGLTFGLGW